MPSINTRKYATFLAKQFAESIDNNTVYLGIGRPLPWDVVGTPDTPTQDVQSVDFAYWRDLLGLKRLNANTDVSLVVSRHDWSADTVYRQYDDTNANLYASSSNTFYVVDQPESDGYFCVYKCLWNNNGRASTVSPAVGVGGNTEPIALSDGYVWQYLYRIEPDQTKFLTTQWMPVFSNTTIAEFAADNAGKLPTRVPIIIGDGGTNYDPSDITALSATIDGDGSGAVISLSDANFLSNSLVQLAFSDGGTGYSKIDSIVIGQDDLSESHWASGIRAIIPPYPNHGYDPITELGTASVMLTTEFRNSEDDQLTIGNDYRRVMLVANPLFRANGAPANASYYSMTFDVQLSANNTNPAFAPDDEITLTQTLYTIDGDDVAIRYPVTARVVDVITVEGNTILRLTDVSDHGRTGIIAETTQNTFMSGDVIECDAKTATIGGAITIPSIRFFSGDVIYVHHHTTITRSAEQVEQFKLVFQFGS